VLVAEAVLFVGCTQPSVIEEKGEGFENGKNLWLELLAFNLN
jgi:hypothetical protein